MRFLLSIFGLTCNHHCTTFPLTPRKSAFKGKTYVCCLDCGREFEYDLAAMKRGAELARWPRRDSVEAAERRTA